MPNLKIELDLTDQIAGTKPHHSSSHPARHLSDIPPRDAAPPAAPRPITRSALAPPPPQPPPLLLLRLLPRSAAASSTPCATASSSSPPHPAPPSSPPHTTPRRRLLLPPPLRSAAASSSPHPAPPPPLPPPHPTPRRRLLPSLPPPPRAPVASSSPHSAAPPPPSPTPLLRRLPRSAASSLAPPLRRRLSFIREAGSAPSPSPAAAPAPPFPSVADAVAAFDSDASPELQCGRCGTAGGLLCGAQSAVCVYCGCPRLDEGGGVAFRDSAAYRWLLGSLGVDGSELVEFDSEPMDSNKSKHAPKSGMVLSDLLNLKLTCPPENRETYGSSQNNEQPSAVYTLNLFGIDLDSFFIKRKEETTAALPRTHMVVQEKQSTNSKSRESSSSEMHVTSESFHSGMKKSSQSTNQTEATATFANWDADFQSVGSESVIGESNQLDLAEFSKFPASGTAITPVVATGNETNMKNTNLEHSEDLASASGT